MLWINQFLESRLQKSMQINANNYMGCLECEMAYSFENTKRGYRAVADL
jgi:hypothetical protein